MTALNGICRSFQKLRPQWFGLASRDSEFKSIAQEAIENAEEWSADALEQSMALGKDVLIVDLRGGLAFKGSHLDTSVNIPADVLESCSSGEFRLPNLVQLFLSVQQAISPNTSAPI